MRSGVPQQPTPLQGGQQAIKLPVATSASPMPVGTDSHLLIFHDELVVHCAQIKDGQRSRHRQLEAVQKVPHYAMAMTPELPYVSWSQTLRAEFSPSSEWIPTSFASLANFLSAEIPGPWSKL